jgi:hypothetical protein
MTMNVLMMEEDGLAVKRLDRLGVVGHAKARVGAAPLIVKLQGKRVQVRVNLRAQQQQRLQTHSKENHSRHKTEEP